MLHLESKAMMMMPKTKMPRTDLLAPYTPVRVKAMVMMPFD